MKESTLFKKTATISLLTSLMIGLYSCNSNTNLQNLNNLENSTQTSTFSKNSNKKKWTIAIHLAADNNLYTAGLDDINEMEAGLNTDEVNVIVLFDGAKKGDSKIYEIKHDKNGYDRKIISQEIEDNGFIIPASNEIDSGDPKVFAKFTDWVTREYPADHTFITIWNHGSGIFRARNVNSTNYPLDGSHLIHKSINDPSLKEHTDFNSKSFASDDKGGEMHLKDLNPALEIAKKNIGKNIDIMGFDTCLMGYMETAYQVKGLANYLVASEELEPGDGWDYDGFLKEVSKDPSMDPAKLSSVLVDTYGKSYASGVQKGNDVTLSSIDINRMVKGLVPAINNFATELNNDINSLRSTIKKVRGTTQSFDNRDSADLGDFITKFSKNPKVRQYKPKLSSLALKVNTELKKSVIREVHSGKKNGVHGATGLQVYFPNGYYYKSKYDNPKEILFAENQSWGSFLKSYTNQK